MPQSLFDTAPLTAHLLGRAGAISLIDPWLERHEAATSVLVYGEVMESLAERLTGIRRPLTG